MGVRYTHFSMELARSARAGLAILRVWVEEGSPEVRARLTTVDDVSAGNPSHLRWSGVGAEDVIREIRAWLEEWERSGP